MNKIIKLSSSDKKMVEKYIQNNYWGLFYLSMNVNKHGLKNDKYEKKSGDYYGYISNGDIKGLAGFSNNKIMHIHYTDKNILKKIDYFRAITHYKPKIIKGMPEIIDETYRLIEHSIKWKRRNDYYVMSLEDEVDIDFDEFEDNIDVKTINNSIEFLVNVERHFGRNPKLVNDIKVKVIKKFENNKYLYIKDNERIISQGMIEQNDDKYNLISGIYTDKRYRKKGYAEKITLGLSKIIQNNGLIPLLLVNQDNDKAINLYKKIGFNTISDFSILELELG